MAKIVTERIKQEARKTITKPEIHTEHHRDVVVDSRYQNLANLLVHIEGANWKVTYYQQVLDDDTGVSGHDVTKDAIYQQYIKIYDMVLKVDSALTWTQNEERKSGSVRGSAYLYPPFIPNAGDVFIADAGDGNPVIFEVLTSEKMSLFKQAVYKIDYASVDYARGERIVNLDNKVIDTRYFEKDFIEYGKDPVLLKDEKKLFRTIEHYRPIILDTYFRKYYSTRFRAMVLPRDDYFIYDHFLTKAVSRWFSSDDYYKLSELRIMSVENLPIMKAESVFEMLEDRDYYRREDIFTRVGVVRGNYFGHDGNIPQLAYSGIDYYIMPLNHRYHVDSHDRYQSRINDLPSPLPSTIYDRVFSGEYKDRPLLPDIDLDSSYIFSQNFYQLAEMEKLSHIELQLIRYMENNNITSDVLFELMKTYPRWGSLQQFYLTPMLNLLLRSAYKDI